MAFEQMDFPEDIAVAYLATTAIPAAIPALWQTLMKIPMPLKGRRCFGVQQPGRNEYWAAFERKPGEELVDSTLRIATIPKGEYAAKHIAHWPTAQLHVEIPAAYHELRAAHTIDPSRPLLEFYDTEDTLWVMVPVA